MIAETNMTEDKVKVVTAAENLRCNEEIEQPVQMFPVGLKDYASNEIVTQSLLQQDIKNIKIPDEENKEITENKHDSETKLNQTTKNITIQQDNNMIEEKNENDMTLVIKNSVQMRLKVLNMELTVIKCFYDKKLIAIDNDTLKKIYMETCKGVHIALDINNFEEAENELLIAENLTAQLMKTINTVLKKDAAQKVVKKPTRSIDIANYRSIVTVKGTKEDVINCILKATAAFKNGKYDRAESLLLKAERIMPTKNARDLLEQVRAAKEPKENADLNEKSTEVIETANTVKEEEESKTEDKNIKDFKNLKENVASKEDTFSANNFAELSQVEAATNNNIMEEKRKEEIEKPERERKIAEECSYEPTKANDAGDPSTAEPFLLRESNSFSIRFNSKSFDATLNLEAELLAVRTKIASNNSKESSDIVETEPEETQSDTKSAAEYFYIAKKAYDAGDFKEAQRNFESANAVDPSLNLKSYLSKCRAAIASRSSTEGIKVIPENAAPIPENACLQSNERNKIDEKPVKENVYNKNSNKRKKICWFCFNLFSVILSFFLYYYFYDM